MDDKIKIVDIQQYFVEKSFKLTGFNEYLFLDEAYIYISTEEDLSHGIFGTDPLTKEDKKITVINNNTLNQLINDGYITKH